MLLALLSLAGCAGASKAPSSPTGAVTGLPRPIRERLANGVVLIVQEDPASEVAAVQLWLRVGGRDETPDELGLSHFLEHMLFKGTTTRPPGSIDRLIEGLGGRSNAFTSYDYTHFDLALPASHVRDGIELLADLAVNASFPPAELDRERQVVLQEMRLLEDDPERLLTRRLFELGYEPHPYGRPILGTLELIRSLTRERLARYYHAHYVPENMVLVVAGAPSSADARAITAATFGALPARQVERRPVAVAAPLAAPRRRDIQRPERQGYLGVAWRAAPVGSEDVFAVDLLTDILGDGPSSRLNQEVRERRGLAAFIEAGYGAWQKGGLVTVTSRVEAGNFDKAEAAILDVIREVRSHGVTEAERERAVITEESDYAFEIETAEGLAKAYGEAETTWTLEDELGYLARLNRVTAGEIEAAALRYLGDRDGAVIRFVPEQAQR